MNNDTAQRTGRTRAWLALACAPSALAGFAVNPLVAVLPALPAWWCRRSASAGPTHTARRTDRAVPSVRALPLLGAVLLSPRRWRPREPAAAHQYHLLRRLNPDPKHEGDLVAAKEMNDVAVARAKKALARQ